MYTHTITKIKQESGYHALCLKIMKGDDVVAYEISYSFSYLWLIAIDYGIDLPYLPEYIG